MSGKDCHSHCHDHKKVLYRQILYCVIAFVVVVTLVVFLVWAIIRPSKPSFVLQDVTVSAFNLSATVPATISTTFQITIISRNSNDRVGVYYQSVDVYATYRNQQITLATSLPSTYQGHKDVNVWSPYLYGNEVPVAPFVGASLTEDLNTGRVLLNIKIDGRVKWKVGTWMSGKYQLHANCPAYITLGGDCNKPTPGGDCNKLTSGGDCNKPTSGGDCNKPTSVAFAAPIKYQFAQGCNVDVAL